MMETCRLHLTAEPWTQDAVRLQLREAAHTIQRLPIPRHGMPGSFKSAWPDVVHDWLGYGWHPSRTPRIPPSPEEISRLDVTLEWLWFLTRDQRLICWARAQPRPWPWKRIQELDCLEHHGRSRTVPHLRDIMHDGEWRIINHLNGTQPRAVCPEQLQTKPHSPAAGR